MIKGLKIAAKLTLPLDWITQRCALLAVSGAGKSNLAAVMAEEMHANGLPFVAIDPAGSWPGLRSSANGKKPGLDIVIFGGRRGDLPLESTAGALIADLVVDKRMSCVLDVSDFSDNERDRFLLDFAERVYRRNTQPLHIYCEEADEYLPQQPLPEQRRLLGAWIRIVRRGRGRALGVTMITQRSAALNKNVLTQIENLFVLRTTAPQDIEAVGAWMKFQGRSKEALASLPTLENGEAWVLSPYVLKRFDRVQIRQRWTFDTGATPKNQKGSAAPMKLAEVDLGAISKLMAETLEQARANDPKELRKEIAELKKQLASSQKAKAAPPAPPAPPPISEQDLTELHALATEAEAVAARLKTLRARIGKIAAKAGKGATAPALVSAPSPKSIPKAKGFGTPFEPKAKAAPTSNGVAMGEGERAILIAVAQHEGGVTREQASILTGYKTSTRNTYIQRLGAKGYVEISGNVVATAAGMAALGDDFEPLPTGDALLQHWLGRLPEGEAKVLEAVVAAHPDAATRDAISQATSYKTSTRNTYIQRLGTRKLVTAAGNRVTAAEELFG